jgi:hypothetical protein
MLANFDAANREACVVRASRTNTPLQALNLMNDVTFLEAARHLAQLGMKHAGEAAGRLTYMFQRATARRPNSKEAEVLARNLQYHLDYFATGGDAARALSYLDQGDSKPDASLEPRELAAYAAVASLILNLDEVITKE